MQHTRGSSDSSPLIGAVELGRLLGAGTPMTLLDVRYRLGGPPGEEEFLRGHLPGAAYVDLDSDLAGPVRDDRAGGRHPLPDPQDFTAAMRRAGVSTSRPVVVYDDWQGRAAGRCWWLLRHYGHLDVRVLDGGWGAWVAAGGEADTGGARSRPGDFAGAPGHLPTVAAGELLDFPGSVVDARESERFRGDVEPVDPVAGHVPGAVNVPTSSNLREDGRFVPVAELAQHYPDGPVAVYCGSGVTATHDALALALLGRQAVLYPGSWSDWVSDASRPTAIGPR